MMRQITAPRRATRRRVPEERGWAADPWFAFAVIALIGIGVVMMSSASTGIADRLTGQPFYYLLRQIVYLGIGLAVAAVILRIPLACWERAGGVLLICALASLALVLVPGVGKEVNGSMRWLQFGVANLQPSEVAKLLVVVYLAGYLVRRRAEVRDTVRGFAKPMAVLVLVCILLLAEPDFGAAAVMLATALGMMFLGGVRLWQFGILALGIAAVLAVAVAAAPYRMARVTTFLDPWADPFNSGFQLTQALIAFGRGEWLGVGLGGSIQKLFYLPEAHTDFLFAVLAEELGLAGSLAVIALFAFVVLQAFVIGRRSERSGNPFGGFLAYGLGLWLGLQAFTNIGVNMGLLPTKGLTLPFMSFGGSSLVVMCAVVALLLRVDHEARRARWGSGERAW